MHSAYAQRPLPPYFLFLYQTLPVDHLQVQVDLVDEASLAVTEAGIRAINGSAAVVRTRRCAVDVGRLLNQGAYSGPGTPPETELDGEDAGQRGAHGGAPLADGHCPDGDRVEHETVTDDPQLPSAGREVNGQTEDQHPESHQSSHLHARRVTSVTLPCAQPLNLERCVDP